MTHFAEVKNNIVVRVIVAEQDFIDTMKGEWIKTSYNTKKNIHSQGKTPLRGNYAGIGYTYDRVNDIFLPPKPYDSFVLNKTTASWEAPIDKPLDSQLYKWNEDTKSWDTAVKRNGGIEFE